MDGCKCRECFGLAEYMLQVTGRAHDLPAAKGCAASQVVLHILTTDSETPAGLVDLTPVRCDGSYGCPCDACERERSFLVRRGVRTTEQPWSSGRRRAA